MCSRMKQFLLLLFIFIGTGFESHNKYIIGIHNIYCIRIEYKIFYMWLIFIETIQLNLSLNLRRPNMRVSSDWLFMRGIIKNIKFKYICINLEFYYRPMHNIYKFIIVFDSLKTKLIIFLSNYCQSFDSSVYIGICALNLNWKY